MFRETFLNLLLESENMYPEFAINQEIYFECFSATRTCAVLTGIHGFTFVSSTCRVVMIHAEHAPKIPIDPVHESELKIPDEELKARLFAHLNTMTKCFQGERLEYQIDVMIQPQAFFRHSGRSLADDQENEKEELFAEPWNLVFSDLRIPEGCDVIQHSVDPGAIFLVDKRGQVEIAFRSHQHDIIQLSGDFVLQSPRYTWNSYIGDIANLDHAIMANNAWFLTDWEWLKPGRKPGQERDSPPVPLKDVVKYHAEPVMPLDIYSPELINIALENGLGHVHYIKVHEGFLPLSVGVWVGTRCGKLALVMEIDDEHHITKIKLLVNKFPGCILRGIEGGLDDSYKVIVIDHVLDLGDPGMCPWDCLRGPHELYPVDAVIRAFQNPENINRQGYLLPISLATLNDKEGRGNLFVVGIGKYLADKSTRKQKLHLWGVQAPSPLRVLDMVQVMGTHMLTFAQRNSAWENIQYQVLSFLESLAEDDSQTGGSSGPRANSFQVLESGSLLMSYLAYAKTMAADDPRVFGDDQESKPKIRVDTTSGINVTFANPLIVKYLLDPAALKDLDFQQIPETSPMQCTLRTSNALIKITGKVAIKALFFPHEGAVISLSAWDVLNETSGISMVGTSSISESKRIRELHASPEAVLKAKFRRAHRCVHCWPSVCRC
jgi:hypothetical protein